MITTTDLFRMMTYVAVDGEQQETEKFDPHLSTLQFITEYFMSLDPEVDAN